MPKVIITGSNSGIGKSSVALFAEKEWEVIMACRNLDSASKAKEEILNRFPSAQIEVEKLDLASFRSVREFSDRIRTKHSSVDSLIHNAGAFNHSAKTFQSTEDGLEMTYQVNVFSPFLLNKKLIPVLKQAPNPSILYASTTNIKYFFDPKREINFDDIFPHGRPYNAYKMYGDSKILQIAMMIQDSLVYPEVRMNAVMIPAVRLDSESRKKLQGIYRLLAFLQIPFAKKPIEIAKVYFYLTRSEWRGQMINSEGRLVTPTGYAQSVSQHFKNLFTDKFYPDYPMKPEIRQGFQEILDVKIESINLD
jgi:NAD(P)-dependent dehydrogenase (short-subunit alcohol dehydrogenase family)